MIETGQSELDDVSSCADALVASIHAERQLMARRFATVARWADVHPPEAVFGPTHARRYRSAIDEPDRAQVGGDGTPLVSEFAATELGVLLETTTTSAQALMRDVLDLRHRLPSVWEAVMTGQVEAWKARRAAQATHRLTFEQARHVDTEILDALTGLPFLRAVDVIEGRVIAADPAAHDKRRREQETQRYVAVGRRPNPAGLRTLVAQTTAGDVARLDAMVDHVAGLLAQAGDTDPLQVRRATALGILADPARACLLMSGIDSVQTDGRPEDQPDRFEDTGDTGDTGDTAVTRARDWGQALRSLGTEALDRLRPATVLYVHLSDHAVSGRSPVARTNLGPVGLDQLKDWLSTGLSTRLGTDRVVVKPVIDLANQTSVDAYETPTWMRELLELREPYEIFPWGTLPSENTDEDHTRPYVPPDKGGPPGQTHPGNLGPLARRHHNAKTHGGFRCYQPLPGLYYWQTPSGYWYQVDHTGTHALGRETPEIIRNTQDHTRTRAELTWGNFLLAV